MAVLKRIRRPRVDYDMAADLKDVQNGVASVKELLVFHETVSAERVGIADIASISGYLSNTKDWGIQLVGDQEGHSAYCGDQNLRQIYYCAASGEGMVNTRAVHYELISDIPKLPTNAARAEAWFDEDRDVQLEKAARWACFLNKQIGLPLVYSDSGKPGITTHWDVTKKWLGGSGHWDCKPAHKGGHFPILEIVYRARQIKAEGGWR